MARQRTIFDADDGETSSAGETAVAPGAAHSRDPLPIPELTAAIAALTSAGALIPPVELPPGPRGTRLWIYDTEVYPNLVLHLFTDGQVVRIFHHGEWAALTAFISDPGKALVGFNNAEYDDPLLRHVTGDPRASVATALAISAQAIGGELPRELRWGRPPWGLSIDIHQLLNGRASLKEWECRLGFGLMAETPYDFTEPVPLAGVADVVRYCANDVHATLALLVRNLDLVAMRQRIQELYGLEHDGIFCASEARIAEGTMLELLRRDGLGTLGALREMARTNPDNGPRTWQLADLVSPRAAFATGPFRAVLEAIRSGSLAVRTDGGIGFAIPGLPGMVAELAGTTFQLGVGGLHSLDRPGSFIADDAWAIIDLDVTSYYPSLMLNEGWFPRHLGPRFLDHLRRMRDQRVAAKRAGDKRTATALKIVINSIYGKLNDQYSGIRSIPDAFRVTVNGQLLLLMLIERLVGIGARILSANTDGVTVRIPRRAMDEGLPAAIDGWQRATGLELERTGYTALHRRDVNNYLAVGEDGSLKTRGAFGEGAKGDGIVIRRAAIGFLIDGTDPATTVAAADAVEDFLFYQRTRRDAVLVQDDAVIGRTARWYASFSGHAILRRLVGETDGGTTVTRGHRCHLAHDIRGWTMANLGDLDRSFYTEEALRLIASVGASQPLIEIPD